MTWVINKLIFNLFEVNIIWTQTLYKPTFETGALQKSLIIWHDNVEMGNMAEIQISILVSPHNMSDAWKWRVKE